MSERVQGILGCFLPGEISVLPRNRKSGCVLGRIEPDIRKIAETEGGKSYQRKSLDYYIFNTIRWAETNSKVADMLKPLSSF